MHLCTDRQTCRPAGYGYLVPVPALAPALDPVLDSDRRGDLVLGLDLSPWGLVLGLDPDPVLDPGVSSCCWETTWTV